MILPWQGQLPRVAGVIIQSYIEWLWPGDPIPVAIGP